MKNKWKNKEKNKCIHLFVKKKSHLHIRNLNFGEVFKFWTLFKKIKKFKILNGNSSTNQQTHQ